MTMAQRESVHSPLTVKEQFEASATRFWSTVKKMNLEESVKHGGVEPSASHQSADERAVSLQSVLHAVFGSCTTGTTYEGQYGENEGKYTPTLSSTITPTSSRGGTMTEPDSPTDSTETPSGSSEEGQARDEQHRILSMSGSKKFFQDSRDRAEEAVLHLREQQLQQQHDLNQHHEKLQLKLQQQALHEQQLKEQQRKGKPDPPERRPTRNSPPAKISNRKKGRPISGIEHHSFFPASNPQTTKQQQKPAVPKEVSSPKRAGRVNATNALRKFASTASKVTPVTTSRDKNKDNDENSNAFEDDGVSVITQETIDDMVEALEKEHAHSSDKNVLNRIYSDVTDPIDESFADWKEALNLSINSGANTSLNPIIEDQTGQQQQLDVSDHFGIGGRVLSRAAVGMSPPRLTREGQSSGTRSFFTKTTYSTQTDDFAGAWKRDEQQYWDTLVHEESNTGVGSNLSATTPTSPSRYSKLRRIRDKVKRELFSKTKFHHSQHSNKGTTTSLGNSRTTAGTTVTPSFEMIQTCSEDDEEVYRAVHDRLMDAMIQGSEQEMAEI